MPEPLTSVEVDAIEERANKATPGPWFRSANWFVSSKEDESCYSRSYAGSHDDWLVCQILGPGSFNNRAGEDFAFITSSRTDVPRLCDDWRAMTARILELQADRERLLQDNERYEKTILRLTSRGTLPLIPQTTQTTQTTTPQRSND